MQTNHTPGPWYTPTRLSSSDSRLGAVLNDKSDAIVIVAAADPDEEIANARLIASAPALLACLRECVDTLERLDARLLRLTESPYENPLGEVTRGRAAIARATGGES